MSDIKQQKKDIMDQLKQLPNIDKTQMAKIKDIIGIEEDSSDCNTNEMVFDKISYKGKCYYKDSAGGLCDADSKLVGTILPNGDVLLFNEAPYELKNPPKKITDPLPEKK